MSKTRKERKMVPMYSAEDSFAGKKDAKPVGWMSIPDEIDSMFVELATLERMAAKSRR